jgi:hypothetical protein
MSPAASSASVLRRRPRAAARVADLPERVSGCVEVELRAAEDAAEPEREVPRARRRASRGPERQRISGLIVMNDVALSFG